MEPMQIDTMAMTRRIREAHAEELKDATPAERIRFFREKARRVHAALAEQMAIGAETPGKRGQHR
jgi:hypothetical protein